MNKDDASWNHWPGRRDGGVRSWGVVFGAFLMQFLSPGCFYAFAVFLEEYIDAFDVGRAEGLAIRLPPFFGYISLLYFCARVSLEER